MALIDNIVGYWKLDNGAYATDSVGSNTLTTTGSTQQSGGFIGYGGSGDNVKASSNFGITGTGNLSISWWAKMTTDITSSGVGFLFQNSTLTTDRLIGLDYEYNSGTRRLNLYNSNNSISQSYNVTLGTGWHHFVIIRTSGSIDLYLDNVKVMSAVAQSTATGTQNVLQIGTGKSYGGTANYYYDEIGIWSRAITSGEVSTLYNSGAGKTYPFGPVFTISETLALSETVTNLRGRSFTISETTTLSEVITALKGISFTISESLNMTEIVTALRGRLFSVVENLSIVEVLAEVRKKWIELTKSSSNWTEKSDNSASWTEKTKN